LEGQGHHHHTPRHIATHDLWLNGGSKSKLGRPQSMVDNSTEALPIYVTAMLPIAFLPLLGLVVSEVYLILL